MRIYGQQGQSQQSQPERQGEALKRFKRGRVSGDLVEGVFMRLELTAPGTAWVNLEGTALLASLPEELAALARRIASGQGAGATPTGLNEADFPIKSGQLCYFILESLEPEPVLRMLNLTKNPGQAAPQIDAALLAERRQAFWQSILRLPLPQLASRYLQKRSALENILQQQLWNSADLALPFPEALPEALTDFFALPADASTPQGLDKHKNLDMLHGLDGSQNIDGKPNIDGSQNIDGITNIDGTPNIDDSQDSSKQTKLNALQRPCGRHEPGVLPEPSNLLELTSPQVKYSAFIKTPGKALEAFNELELYRAALVENLKPYGLLGFFFIPWLCPKAKHLELAFYRQPSAENFGANRTSALQGENYKATGSGALQGVSYKLQGELEQGEFDSGKLEQEKLRQGELVQGELGQSELAQDKLAQGKFEQNWLQTRPELNGILGNPRTLRHNLKPDAPDLLRFILALRPVETRPSFSRKA